MIYFLFYMTYKENDFVRVEFDIYANGELVQTTNEKKGKAASLDVKKYGPLTIVLGRNFLLRAMDEDIIKNNPETTEKTLDLSADEAYGKRQKDMIKTFPKSTFDEKKLRAIPGVTYDFNGMFGKVKSVVGGRVMVDFNNPLAGKSIKLTYKIIEKVEDMKEKLNLVLNVILKMPENTFEILVNAKNVTLKAPGALIPVRDQLKKSFEELIPEFKDYSLEIQSFKKE